MKKCQCGKIVENSQYRYCHSCWQIQDPRDFYRSRVRNCLEQMTEAALDFDMIFAQPIEAAEYDYDPKYGPKLFWDTSEKRYVAKLPDGTII